MNLVGKIFVVLIFVMSVVFMSFAMAVYTVQRNWREVVVLPPDSPLLGQPGKELGLKYQLAEIKTRNEDLRNQRERAEKDRDTEKVSKIQALTKLETERDELLKERRNLEAGYAGLEKDKRDAVAAMNSTQKVAADYRKELEALREEVLQSQQDRDEHFKEVVRLTDELHQAVNEKEQLRKRAGDVSKDLAKAREALRYHDIDEKSDYKSKTPPRVDGVVLATPGAGLIEISIGSDDGLRKGHRLDVYRASGGSSTYVGRIEVVKTAPDRSVCKIDPKFQNSRVMEGDRVDSKID